MALSWLTALSLLTAAIALMTSGDAHADGADESRNLVLGWSAPSECPSRDPMRARILQLVGEGKHSRDAVDATVRIERRSNGALFDANVTLSAGGRTTDRHLDGDSCEAVSDAAALIIALAIDPEAAASPAPTTPGAVASETTEVPWLAPPAVAASQPPSSPPPTPIEGSPRDASNRTTNRPFYASASGRFDVGSVPAPVLGAELALGWNPGRFDFELGGALMASARGTLASNPDQGARIGVSDLGTRACYLLFGTRLDLAPCGGIHVRFMSAQGFGTGSDHDATAVFGLASLGALIRWQLTPRISVRFAGDALVPLSRPTFVIDAAGTVYQAPPVAARAAVGFEFHL